MPVYMSAEVLYYLHSFLSATPGNWVGNWVQNLTLSGFTLGQWFYTWSGGSVLARKNRLALNLYLN